MAARQPYAKGDGHEYAACWEQYDGGWWPEQHGGLNSIDEALQWLASLDREVKHVRVIRRPTGDWEQIYP